MPFCYRYWAWNSAVDKDFLSDMQLWSCTVEYHKDCVDIWVPEQAVMFVQLKYPTLQRHPVFDRY